MSTFQIAIKKLHIQSDSLGVSASALCLIHCLITPFIFVTQAYAISSYESAPLWWRMVDYLFLVISFIAIHYSAKDTTLKWMPTALYTNWTLLAIFILNEQFHLFPLSHALLYLPAFTLIVLHLYNRRYCYCEEEKCCVPE